MGREVDDESLAKIIDTKSHLNLEIDRRRSIGNKEPEITDKYILGDTNARLTSIYIEEEVIPALKRMGPTKAFGEDGFQLCFSKSVGTLLGGTLLNFAWKF
ncbi:hypothetical protein EPI10_016023 [Gossypium australe]|uniref:Reverse transcriptase n=1 Tax=Gossypium australe TaxID=47621 RepID=A0A5B6VMM3_9ROSI|nr:hypothetical protein EPI10_016023 [Gossypium australe]